MKEIDSCYYKENGDIIFCFTKRDVDAKSESELEDICKELGINLKNIKYNEQVHGSDIIEVDEMSKIGCSADALITDKENVPLMIFTADCVPLVFYDKVTNVVALAHAGWKGTYANIAKNTVNTMINKYDVDVKNIEVVIGPSISRDNYQVSKELIEKFSELNIDNYYTIRDSNYYLDLWTINGKQLENMGIPKENIVISNLCTVADNDKFFSYRKDNNTKKRIGTIIQIRGKKDER